MTPTPNRQQGGQKDDDFGLGRVVAHMSWTIAEQWERTLRLHIKPKPSWMPLNLWRKILDLVVVQSDTTIPGRFQ